MKLLEESRKLCRIKDVFIRMILSRFKSALKTDGYNSLSAIGWSRYDVITNYKILRNPEGSCQ